MEIKYRLTGVTDYAEKHLSVDDLEEVKSMIGTECRLGKYPSLADGKREFVLIDGQSTHEDFIIIEKIPEPIQSDQTQIEKLEAEKKELVEMLYNARLALSKYDDQLSYDILSLIKKHKQ